MTQGRIQLVPLAADTLAFAEPWFQDEQTRRWLGGPGWPTFLRVASFLPAIALVLFFGFAFGLLT